MTEFGTVFPPRNEWDIAAYDTDEVVSGYREWRPDEPAPGDNRSPAYRWGWTNARRDRFYRTEDDGFSPIRQAYIALSRRSVN
jgi:hypothetical protein